MPDNTVMHTNLINKKKIGYSISDNEILISYARIGQERKIAPIGINQGKMFSGFMQNAFKIT